MKNKILILPVLFALVSIFSSCEKDEDRVYLPDTVIAPEFVSTPTLDLKRENAEDTVVFVAIPIDLGFQASIKYLMQVRPAGDTDAKPSSIYSSTQDTLIKMSVGDLNGYLKPKAKPWIPTALDFILKAELNSSAGRGAEEFVFLSLPVPIIVTTYGDPKLDLIDSGTEQALEDFEDGEYSGEVELLVANPFTLSNPETGIVYGGSDGTLVVDGAGIVAPVDGDFQIIVDLEAMTYELIRISAAIMDVIDSGTDQSLTSPTGNGIYTGLILLNPDGIFTLYEQDTEITFGGSEGILIADGAAISPPDQGWHMATVDVNEMTYTLEAYSIGVVGAFTEWGTLPDIPMDYDPEEEFWFANIDLPVGPMKFRLNEDWIERWGPGTNTELPEAGGTMELPNADADILITTAGNYDIELTITGTSAEAKFTLN